jgi:hypothetical protein
MPRLLIAIACLLISALAIAACSSDDDGDGPDATPTPAETVEPGDATDAPTPDATAEPDSPATSFGDGSHVVGTDIEPGTYRSSASTTTSDSCFWQRQSGFGMSNAIASRLVNNQTVVTIVDSDAGFFSQNCGTWSPADSAVTASLTDPFSGGTFIVGTDIAAGPWRHDASGQCFWQRLSGFSGELDEIITEQSDDPQVVEIAETDAGFFSEDCGTWTRAD